MHWIKDDACVKSFNKEFRCFQLWIWILEKTHFISIQFQNEEENRALGHWLPYINCQCTYREQEVLVVPG